MVARGSVRRRQQSLAKERATAAHSKAPTEHSYQSKPSPFSYLAVGIIGAALSAVALFATGWWQSETQAKIASDTVAVEWSKIELGKNQLAAEVDKMALERERFEYAKLRDAQLDKSAINTRNGEALARSKKQQWDREQLDKTIELQNKNLYAQLWFACLNATALVRQPVAIAPANSAMSYGSVSSGEDTIKCIDRFKKVDFSALDTAFLPREATVTTDK